MSIDKDRQRDALDRLSDALSEDILKTPGDELLAEAQEDHGDPLALAKEFDRIFLRKRRGSKIKQLMAIIRNSGIVFWQREMIADARGSTLAGGEEWTQDTLATAEQNAPLSADKIISHLAAQLEISDTNARSEATVEQSAPLFADKIISHLAAQLEISDQYPPSGTSQKKSYLRGGIADTRHFADMPRLSATRDGYIRPQMRWTKWVALAAVLLVAIGTTSIFELLKREAGEHHTSEAALNVPASGPPGAQVPEGTKQLQAVRPPQVIALNTVPSPQAAYAQREVAERFRAEQAAREEAKRLRAKQPTAASANPPATPYPTESSSEYNTPAAAAVRATAVGPAEPTAAAATPAPAVTPLTQAEQRRAFATTPQPLAMTPSLVQPTERERATEAFASLDRQIAAALESTLRRGDFDYMNLMDSPVNLDLDIGTLPTTAAIQHAAIQVCGPLAITSQSPLRSPSEKRLVECRRAFESLVQAVSEVRNALQEAKMLLTQQDIAKAKRRLADLIPDTRRVALLTSRIKEQFVSTLK